MRLLIYLLVLISTSLYGQKSKTYIIRTVAFYNCENLFDTVNDSLTFDDDRTPEGRYHWTQERYQQKLDNLSHVISQIGADTSKSSPDIVGLCEVENLDVLEDLVQHPNLRDKDYGIIHFDSPDERGIDVALLYKKASFIPSSFKSHRLLLFDDLGERKYTRDQLVVGGTMDGEKFHFVVNHWPSRRGGAARSEPFRVRAALLNKRIIDSIQTLDPDAKVIAMGDLNDDPIDNSLKTILKTKGKIKQLDSLDLYNPMEALYKKGIGSLAYQDKWNLFDQLFFTSNLVTEDRTNLSFWKAGIFAPSFVRTDQGRFKGYPLRTYSGGSYTAGYSDHFPVYLFLLKEAE
ncbi:endonuclease/exonuclease/phosphatase family protein [Allomuricauda sp.]|jgi:predicted extracellular nuclease|uniref:endonuclease/exonuclease/phosphatase family protein n=1 Tax=Flagellimonas sp. TaxID=2058762 RepID=UPI001B1696B3|nr:endonuclease/exonuclease/phosphatase family protein [Allomuricauda sp.]MBO6533858.1 endonuclease/exonuclease/phosphatase family protein [Allomuricauda sp.]MBO6587803.1 endonuclease/exonuclease/phosphatase family protein [Allomuricauda sp.]MBO6617428.1 endonuclease/exonuclease/phosphatase family protein [Allomuricauda sp.]MBO6643561.1 endonuclease/exonuclease/phosphatase family protein [Allomuricauda sp.]MBO6745763.1 endonuclease/exonuclease/phosphatase family protein [Allomuricauda sp.]